MTQCVLRKKINKILLVLGRLYLYKRPFSGNIYKSFQSHVLSIGEDFNIWRQINRYTDIKREYKNVYTNTEIDSEKQN